MQLKNAIKKIEEKGYKVEHVAGERNKTYRAIIGENKDRVLEFHSQNWSGLETILCIGVRSINEQSDPMTDYCAFSFYDNLTQALRFNA